MLCRFKPGTAKRQFLAGVLASLLLLGFAAASEGLADPSGNGKRIKFDEISFALPGGDWIRVDADARKRITFIRACDEQTYQALGIWSEQVLRRENSGHHASNYFDWESSITRSRGVWDRFLRGERLIEGKRYHTMSFSILDPTVQPAEFHADGLFLLIFPPDFEKRQKFYVLMWVDSHPVPAEARGLDELDAVVASFLVQPLNEGKQ